MVSDKKKKDLNQVIGNVIICFSWIIFAASILSSLFFWVRSGNSTYLIGGGLTALGLLTSIFFSYRERSRKIDG